jgi:hypothetical protein
MRKDLYYSVMAMVFMLLLLNSEGYSAEKFIPVHAGQTFTYSVKDGIGNTARHVMRISGTTNIPCLNKNYFLVDMKYTYQGVPLDNAAFFNFRSTLTKVFVYDGFCKEHLKWQQAPVGTTWSYVELEGDEIENTILAIENVTVPAGTFKGCLKIEHRCTNCSGDARWIEWAKPGFFMVQWVDYWADNQPVTYKLIKWTD